MASSDMARVWPAPTASSGSACVSCSVTGLAIVIPPFWYVGDE
ncbi:hypothetical protein ACW5XA_15350 [Aeromonas dhakensis]